MTTGIFRWRAVRHTAHTNSGKRLSTRTASTSATNAAVSFGRARPRLTPRRVAMVFSPEASSRMSETDAVPPSTRTALVQSMPSLPRSDRIRLLTVSSAPPSGPAKATHPFSRAIATAAFAAHPPPVMMNSLAATLVPGPGKFSTRMTMSCTAMPAQRIFGTFVARSVKAYLVLHPDADDVVRDRNRRRRRQPLRMFAHQHGLNLFLAKPPSVLELRAIDHNLVRQCFNVTADHQRCRERPWLRSEVDDAAAGDAGFLARFPTDGILERFAGLNEPGKARPHRWNETRATPQQAALAVTRQHDHNWIGAGKVLGLAQWAVAPPAAIDEPRHAAAVRAESVARMHVQHRLGFSDRRQVVLLDQTLDRDGTQIGDMQIAA